jgi:MerR family transcriptional regulator, thiopeptide resistance regulator
MYTIKELASLAGVTTRTLRFYDQIGLLKPASLGRNGYRYYNSESAMRLQQLLFYKRLGFDLQEIRSILDNPNFNLLDALKFHRIALKKQIGNIQQLIHTVDMTIQKLMEGANMNDDDLFVGFSEEKQKEYEKEIRERYGEHAFDGVIDWNCYSREEKSEIISEGQSIHRDLAVLIGSEPGSEEVQSIISRWHQHMRYFYDPDPDRMLGLAQMYVEHPEFNAAFSRIHPGLPEFFREAIEYYVANGVH